jgi:uncharacterized membrane protein
MFESAYRQRLEADLARWQSGGLITPAIGAAIRNDLGPSPQGVNVATMVGIVGGLLIAAAFLAFIAANWSDIARPARFAVLLAGIAGAYAAGAWFDRDGRTHLADLSATVGSIIFGAAIALTGQMYHLGGDFAGGVMLWAIGALVAATLTGSRGALAVALAVACLWSGMRAIDQGDAPHLPFIAFWLVAAGLALVWNAVAARHVVAVAALAWWIISGIALIDRSFAHDPILLIAASIAAGGSLLLGAGLLLASLGPESQRRLGTTLSNYGALALAVAVAMYVPDHLGLTARNAPVAVPFWMTGSAVAGGLLAFAAAAVVRRPGPAFAGLAIGLALAVTTGGVRPTGLDEPWLMYGFALSAMLALGVSGMLDDMRPRVVAGWLGLAAVIATITWTVPGSLLRRAVFLAVSGSIAIALAIVLGRLTRKEAVQ